LKPEALGKQNQMNKECLDFCLVLSRTYHLVVRKRLEDNQYKYMLDIPSLDRLDPVDNELS